MTLDDLIKKLSGYRFRFTSEKDLQDGIVLALNEARIPYRREFMLNPKARPDFMLADGIAVEVKIKGSLSELLRQASRYAGHAEVKGILVIGTPRWLPRVPDTLCGKPVRSLRLIGSLL